MRSITYIDKNQEGFTLVELMIGLALTGLVLAGVVTFYQKQHKSYIAQEEVAVMQQNLRAAANMMARELRMATYDPVNRDGGLITALPGLLVFENEIDIAGNMQTTQYDLYDAYGDGDTDIGRMIDGVAKRSLAENIDALEFVYLDATGATTAVLDEITTIQVSMLARSSRAEPDFLNNLNYYPASCPQGPGIRDSCITGAKWTAAAPTWNFDGNIGNGRNSFDDNFRRRLLTATIELRN